MAAPELSVCFTEADVALFAQAAHDHNPLHVSASYARQSSAGEPVVFGMLGVLACLGYMKPAPGRCLTGVSCDFIAPMLVGPTYQVLVSEADPASIKGRILDGSRLMMEVTVTFQPGVLPSEVVAWESWPAPERPHDPDPGTFVAGLTDSGTYAPEAGTLAQLATRFSLVKPCFWGNRLAVLLLSSFLIGMRLPGRQALFHSCRIEFSPLTDGGPSLAYETRIERFDPRFRLLRLVSDVQVGGHTVASIRSAAIVRPVLRPAHQDDLRALVDPGIDFTGQVALIVGGSRGLGAAFSQLFALSGGTVYVTYHMSGAVAAAMRDAVPEARQRIHLVAGDMARLDHNQALAERISRESGRLDYLICNAAPAIPSLRIEATAAERIAHYVHESLALALMPMSVCLPLLEQRAGTCVFVSSSAINDPPAEWPHYVAAKMAIEGLVHTAAKQYANTAFVIARPVKLLTDLTNTPMGRHGAVSPSHVAAEILMCLHQANPPGIVTVQAATVGQET
ncbi:MAG: SDR family NAD(P)-dependent oxidoreductase [Candidatus Sericytochromatia bacterium]|nr:SDR family NAD(P)-dependent oxidoreductase [Candidatus Sericytochromatia bacterium]